MCGFRSISGWEGGESTPQNMLCENKILDLPRSWNLLHRKFPPFGRARSSHGRPSFHATLHAMRATGPFLRPSGAGFGRIPFLISHFSQEISRLEARGGGAGRGDLCWLAWPWAAVIVGSGTWSVTAAIRNAEAVAEGPCRRCGIDSVCRKPPFLEFEPASAVKFDPDLTGGFGVKWTWSATFGGKRRAGGDFGAHIGDFRKYRAWRAAGSPVRAALAGFPGDVRQLFVAGT